MWAGSLYAASWGQRSATWSEGDWSEEAKGERFARVSSDIIIEI